jgi:putative heme iron utilization protein
MDSALAAKMAHIIHTSRQASLGTIRNGFPFVSMILATPASDFCAFYMHISQIAQHTQDIKANPRVSLMFMEIDNQLADPQQLGRISIAGQAFEMHSGDSDYPEACSLYLKRYPASAAYFAFSDFYTYRIVPEKGRFVAGFSKTINLTLADLRQASQTL